MTPARSKLSAATFSAVALAMLNGLAGDARGQTGAMTSAFQIQLTNVKLRVVDGRFLATAKTPIRRRLMMVTVSDRRERLELNGESGEVSFRYELATPRFMISFDLVNGDQVTIRREPRSDATVIPLDFKQPASGPIALVVGAGEARREYLAPSLWHLLLLERKVCQAELAPLIDLVRPALRLMKTVEDLEQRLSETTEQSLPLDRSERARLVAELASERFAHREAAERAFIEAGSEMVPFLRDTERRPLDAEQLFRIRGALRALAAESGEDTSESIAATMAGDPHVWHRLLARDDQQLVQVAMRKLSILLEKPVQFDPTTDIDQRRKQLETLAAQIEQSWPY